MLCNKSTTSSMVSWYGAVKVQKANDLATWDLRV